jgi:hypothetical protein
VARNEPITRLEVAACPMHRQDLKHYVGHVVGCDCMRDERRAELAKRLTAARAEGNELADIFE